MPSLSSAVGFAKRVRSDFSEKNVTFMAAGLAYNAFISLAPMLIVLVLVLTTIGAGLRQRIVAAVGTWLPGPVADIVTQLLQGNESAGSTSIIGLVVLIWGTLKIFRGLDTAFSEIYETEDVNSFLDKVRDGVVVLVALLLAVVAVVATTALFAAFADMVPYLGLLTPLVLVAGLAVAFYPIYYVFPDTEMELSEPLPGVVFAAVGWAVFQGLFQVYLSVGNAGSGRFAGGIIIVITYLYFSSLVLLLGAVINAVLSGHSSGKPGGVGTGAASHETVREGDLGRRDLAEYLDDLRVDLLGNGGETPAPVRTDDGRRPAGDVHLVEHASADRSRRAVTLEWSVADESGASGERSDSRNAGAAGERRSSGASDD